MSIIRRLRATHTSIQCGGFGTRRKRVPLLPLFQDRHNPLDQLLKHEVRLHHIVGDAELFGSLFVFILVQVGEDDDRYILELGILSERFQNLKAVHSRKYDVEKHHVGMDFLCFLKGFFAAEGRIDFDTVLAQLFQLISKKIMKERVVLDDEYFLARQFLKINFASCACVLNHKDVRNYISLVLKNVPYSRERSKVMRCAKTPVARTYARSKDPSEPCR